MPTYTIQADTGQAGRLGTVRVDATEYGAGRPFLLLHGGLLHGGAGPRSVAAFAETLAANQARVTVLNTFTPDLYIGYFRELRDQIAAGRPLSAELIGETMRHYATS
ncbi:MAG TPA: hypothetical protein VGG16_28885 [Streptosporangiaceae bacterium]|jgi:hypothetical protein